MSVTYLVCTCAWVCILYECVCVCTLCVFMCREGRFYHSTLVSQHFISGTCSQTAFLMPMRLNAALHWPNRLQFTICPTRAIQCQCHDLQVAWFDYIHTRANFAYRHHPHFIFLSALIVHPKTPHTRNSKCLYWRYSPHQFILNQNWKYIKPL